LPERLACRVRPAGTVSVERALREIELAIDEQRLASLLRQDGRGSGEMSAVLPIKTEASRWTDTEQIDDRHRGDAHGRGDLGVRLLQLTIKAADGL
jgi:hypothetical protein